MNLKDIEKLAELAKIELSESEKEKLLKDLDSILSYVKIIESVEIPYGGQGSTFFNSQGRTLPTSRNVMREDVVVPRAFARAALLNQFPDSQDGFLKVTKIL
jgi:aspartyl-tRNA(Asn)/glutamyl-tRNA(Gln) amidotransferase subunit C